VPASKVEEAVRLAARHGHSYEHGGDARYKPSVTLCGGENRSVSR